MTADFVLKQGASSISPRLTATTAFGPGSTRLIIETADGTAKFSLSDDERAALIAFLKAVPNRKH